MAISVCLDVKVPKECDPSELTLSDDLAHRVEALTKRLSRRRRMFHALLRMMRIPILHTSDGTLYGSEARDWGKV